MSEVDQYAAWLTDQTAQELVKARSRLRSVADTTHDFDRVMSNRLQDLGMIPPQADRARDGERRGRGALDDAGVVEAGQEVRLALRNAQQTAGQAISPIGAAQRELNELGDELKESAGAIEAGMKHLDELEKLPGRKTNQTENLRERLQNLQSAVDSAGTALGQAVGRLESARTAAAAFERLETGLDSSGRVSNAIDQAGTTMRTEVQAARIGLTGLTGQLDRNQSEVSKTTQQSIDLANAVRAGLNPTPPSAERVSNGAAEQDLRLRGAEHTQSTDRDR